ncbi:MAG: DUF3179 domain-containing (seleno)protein [Bacteroidota bacterium]
MKRMKTISLILLGVVLAVMISCAPKEHAETVENASKEDTKTIELVAQEWPGQEPKRYDMPVNSGLDKLEFGDPANVALDAADLVLGITLDDLKVAVPLTYLEGFEVANFSLHDEKYLITWCALVGSAQIFTGNIQGDTLGFDFGRALIDNNLLMVDRKTRSVWNQLSNEAIHGELKGTKLELLPTIQTTWGYWKGEYPDTKVLINKDTTGAIWPSLLFSKPRYTSWKPTDGKFHMADHHQSDNLGFGLEVGDSSIYFPFETLFTEESPIVYSIADQSITVHFNRSGLTAWAEDSAGHMLPGTLAYNWAWNAFYPKSLIFKN